MINRLHSALLLIALMLLPIAASAQSTSQRVSKAELISTDFFPGTSDSERTYIANIETCREMIADDANLRFKWSLVSAYDDTSLLYALKVEGPSGSCNTGSAGQENDENCTVIDADRSVGSRDEFLLDIDARDIFGFSSADMCEGRNENYDVTLVLPYIGTEDKTHEPDAVRLRLQTQRPEIPADVTVKTGGSSILVEWTATSDARGHVVYVSTTPFTGGDTPETLSDAKRHTVSTGESFRVTSGITPEQEYYVAVTTRDSVGNESLLSSVRMVTTEQTIDFWEDYLNHGGSERGGYCTSMSASDGGWLALFVFIGLLWRRSSRRRAGSNA